jgi:hypothetical protein
MIQWNSQGGSIVSQFDLSDKEVLAFQCSSAAIFVLYSNAKITQYNQNDNFSEMFTYFVSNTKALSQYNTLKISKEYLFCALCDGSPNSNSCNNVSIYQWNITKTSLRRSTKTTQQIAATTTNFASPTHVSNVSVEGTTQMLQSEDVSVYVVSVVSVFLVLALTFGSLYKKRRLKSKGAVKEESNKRTSTVEFVSPSKIIIPKSAGKQSNNNSLDNKNSDQIYSEIISTVSSIATTASSEFWNSTQNTRSTLGTTQTMRITYPGIYIPGFKSTVFEEDFMVEDKLTSGGYGDIFIGKITNYDIFHNFNNDTRDCIIKKSHKPISKELFLQELSIHELFRAHKYFAKLVCFSEEPNALVLKFYRFGTLKAFAFPKPNLESTLTADYTITLVVSLSKRIAWAINHMHEKGVIHNDIKLDNILLDGDQDEPVFPVISDFGLVKILYTADILEGFDIQEKNGLTPVYSAPEVLLSSQKGKKQRVSNVKTDAYSVGVVMYELFCREEMWRTFNAQKLLNGCLPNISFPKICARWKRIKFESANAILNLLMDSMDTKPSCRSSLGDIMRNLEKTL